MKKSLTLLALFGLIAGPAVFADDTTTPTTAEGVTADPMTETTTTTADTMKNNKRYTKKAKKARKAKKTETTTETTTTTETVPTEAAPSAQ